MTENNREARYLIHLLSCAINEKQAEYWDGIDYSRLLKLSFKHQVFSTIYSVLSEVDGVPSEHMQSFRNYYMNYVQQALMLSGERNAIFDELIENKIRYMPLKGSVLKLLYPKPEMRTMSDIDILIRTEQYAKIKKIMRALGYREGTESDHELHWSKLDVHIELHKCLIPSYNEDYYVYFGDGWQRARLCAAGSSRYQMTPEDEFIYLFCHFAKHYRDGGIGIKHLADLWVYRRHYPNLDEAYLRAELEKLSLAVFYDNITATCAFWFEAAAP